MPTMVITGASSGLGSMLMLRMRRQGWRVFNLSLRPAPRSSDQDFIPCNVSNFHDTMMAAERMTDPVDVVVNCAAMNYIDYLEEASVSDWDTVMDTNAKGLFLMAKSFLPQLKMTRGTICNITSDAAWKPMTGSSAYNASKGAAHILTQQLARELTRRHGICVFGVAPGKLMGTGMSTYIDGRVQEMRGWSSQEAYDYAKAGRLWPEEIPPEHLAEFLSYILAERIRHRYFSGCIIPFGA